LGLVIFQSLGFFSSEIILNPYFWIVSIVVILLLLFWVVYEINERIKKDLKKIEKFQRGIANNLELFKNNLEEKFKMHDRLNKLELEVFNGKKRFG